MHPSKAATDCDPYHLQIQCIFWSPKLNCHLKPTLHEVLNDLAAVPSAIETLREHPLKKGSWEEENIKHSNFPIVCPPSLDKVKLCREGPCISFVPEIRSSEFG